MAALDITEVHIRKCRTVHVGFSMALVGDGSQPIFLFEVAAHMVKVPCTQALRPQASAVDTFRRIMNM
ncbi:hypothetical protein BDP27DRAFT_1323405 [Rhodocollybia butyracea]|uniref:Uncharacterized protein n=1 Tax=Rhodocollybia butyracea TaxID=206335 RepID=A0A9P5TWG5_9AGAR|nr:hypothetical protein BDP27DRAFT_1347630 [Rhodocollybia butyracea]KAF9064987.1 hypothetical protein BDP27DRAFT_1332743 [Rhodocollybia butyracea]KAF9067861.1 hypothetical protein BDP27DRAFT_1328172 [Rhodocollybia butyracea]KAF9070762.1 hypothetical protein BDP27DRAFT_1323405 [Rhodocollybia butyracea]